MHDLENLSALNEQRDSDDRVKLACDRHNQALKPFQFYFFLLGLFFAPFLLLPGVVVVEVS
jgi:hypothetical protein